MLLQMDNKWHITLYHYWFNNKLNLNEEAMKKVHPLIQWLVAPLLAEKLQVPPGLFGSHHSELWSGLDCITATPWFQSFFLAISANAWDHCLAALSWPNVISDTRKLWCTEDFIDDTMAVMNPSPFTAEHTQFITSATPGFTVGGDILCLVFTTQMVCIIAKHLPFGLVCAKNILFQMDYGLFRCNFANLSQAALL